MLIDNLLFVMDEVDCECFWVEILVVICGYVVLVYQWVLDFFNEEYMLGLCDSIGIFEVLGGCEYYQLLVCYYMIFDILLEEVYQWGLFEVVCICVEMEEVIVEIGFDGMFV